jgi:hypothetical protein
LFLGFFLWASYSNFHNNFGKNCSDQINLHFFSFGLKSHVLMYVCIVQE